MSRALVPSRKGTPPRQTHLSAARRPCRPSYRIWEPPVPGCARALLPIQIRPCSTLRLRRRVSMRCQRGPSGPQRRPAPRLRTVRSPSRHCRGRWSTTSRPRSRPGLLQLRHRTSPRSPNVCWKRWRNTRQWPSVGARADREVSPRRRGAGVDRRSPFRHVRASRRNVWNAINKPVS